MLVEIFYMCSIALSGAVDCDDQWLVYLFDQEDVSDICNMEGVGGCSWGNLKDKSPEKNYIIAGGMGKTIMPGGETVLQHEIDHLKCLCNYHKENK